MNDFARSWNRLTGLARRATAADEAVAAPPGFATRVAALWLDSQRPAREGTLWEWFSLRSLAVAASLMVVAVAATWPGISQAEGDQFVDLADPLAVEELAPS